MPRPPSTPQDFSLIAQSGSAILMCETPVYGFNIVIKSLIDIKINSAL